MLCRPTNRRNGSYVPVLMAHGTNVFHVSTAQLRPINTSGHCASSGVRARGWHSHQTQLSRPTSSAAPARELNCVVAARPAESPYLRLGLLQGYSCLCLVMDSRHGVLRRVDHLMIKNPARNRDLHFELVAKWTNV